MASATPPSNTILFIALGLAGAFLYSRQTQRRMTNAAYSSAPYASPMPTSYMGTPAAGGWGWAQTQNQALLAQRGQPAAQQDPYASAGKAIGTVLSKWLSPNTDAPYNAAVPDQYATGSDPSMNQPPDIPADLANWYG